MATKTDQQRRQVRERLEKEERERLSPFKSRDQIRKEMRENAEAQGENYCLTCDNWWYGISNTRCNLHNPKPAYLPASAA